MTRRKAEKPSYRDRPLTWWEVWRMRDRTNGREERRKLHGGRDGRGSAGHGRFKTKAQMLYIGQRRKRS